jgi:hypothetical protein
MDITSKYEKAIQLRKNSIPDADLLPIVAKFLRERADIGQYYTTNSLSQRADTFGIGQKKLKTFIQDWEHSGQLRRLKVDGQPYSVLLPPAIYECSVD